MLVAFSIPEFNLKRQNSLAFHVDDRSESSRTYDMRLSIAGMRVNISKSNFFAEQIEYLGYWITRQGIQPICNKVEASLNINIKAHKTRK
jgi:hypothetical protein